MQLGSELKGFLPFSLIDWPGKVCAVLFFAGCNFACPTCHNFILATDGASLPSLDWEKVTDELRKKKKWLDGVVLTGGEVTLLQYLPELCFYLKKIGYLIKVDSNGFQPEVIENLFRQDLVELFAIDVKGPWEKYSQLVGKNIAPEDIKNKMEKIFTLAKKHQHPERFLFRLTKVPMLSDEDVQQVKTYLPPNFELKIQKYKPVKKGGFNYA